MSQVIIWFVVAAVFIILLILWLAESAGKTNIFD